MVNHLLLEIDQIRRAAKYHRTDLNAFLSITLAIASMRPRLRR